MNDVLSGILLIACQVIYNGSPSLAAVPVCTPEQLVESSLCTSLNLCGTSLQSQCSVICGLCQPAPPTTTAPETTPAPTTRPVCTPEQLVESSLCTSLNLCGTSLESQCSVTCGLCEPPPPTTTAPETTTGPTTLSVCTPEQLVESSLCTSLNLCGTSLESQCSVTCGLCQPQPPTTVPTETTPAPTTLPVCTPEQLVESSLCTSLNLCGTSLESQCSIICGLCQPPLPTTQQPETTAATTTESATTTETPTTTESATTTETPTTTESATTTETPTTTESATTTETVATTESATTTESPTTTESATTTESPTTTESATTTETPTTTESTTTTESPTTTESATTTETATTTESATTTETATTTESVTTTESPTTTESATTTETPTTTESATTTETPTTTESTTTTGTTIIMASQECCIFVTLAIYSGRQDPRWLISSTDNDTDNCTSILMQITQAKNLNQLRPHECMPRKTGYKGFLVQIDEDENLIVGNDTSFLQLKLLETMPEKLQPTVEFREQIRSEILFGNISADCPSGVTKRFAPPFEPDLFNADENTRRLNNCYNYASTIITNSYAQPGRATGGPFFPLVTADAIRAGAISDGFADLTPVPGPNEPVPEIPTGPEHVVALFFVNDTCGGDFHFYRLDDDGSWSHKPGQTGATRLDDSGAIISDPRSADTGAYIFERFLVVNNDTVRII